MLKYLLACGFLVSPAFADEPDPQALSQEILACVNEKVQLRTALNKAGRDLADARKATATEK